MTLSDVARTVVAALWAHGDPEVFLPTLQSLRATYPDLVVYVASDAEDVQTLVDAGAEARPARSLGMFLDLVREEHDVHILAIGDPVIVPPGFLSPALELVADARVGTVSFLSNAAAFLSFPHRDRPTIHQIDNTDEISLTNRLRADGGAPVSIPWATGAAVLMAASALSSTGPMDDGPGDGPELTFADFSLRARRRGFIDLLDPTTFVARPTDLAELAESPDWSWLYKRHPFVTDLLSKENSAPESPLAVTITSARAAALGLNIAIDGSTLGPKEMGTQVVTVCLIEALAERDDVSGVSVLLLGDRPAYAQRALSHPKVFTSTSPDDIRADIAHRPYQPDGGIGIDTWRAMGRRTVVTMQDVIAYQIGAYFSTPDAWLEYRAAVRSAVGAVDGVVALTRYTRDQMEVEHLPIDADRTFIVGNGTDHFTGDEAGTLPVELARRGFVSGAFALVIGANYSHKNRDLAIAAFTELRKRGVDLSLVCVGAMVPYGSSRIAEARLLPTADDVFVLPDVSSEERNWLLRHAAVVLYPTGAEGFGLVPYEAARFGTPTVMIEFGPLSEVGGAQPVSAATWSASAIADAAEKLLTDPALARAQVDHGLAAAGEYNWATTADKLIAVYRTLISRPARHLT